MSRRAAVARPRLRSFPLRRGAWLALIAPAILMLWSAYAMWATYSPSLYADQWVDLARWRAAPRTGWLAYLFSLNNEHRIFFPRLVFMADWAWFQGRGVLSLVAVGLIQLAGAAFFIHLARIRRSGALGLLGLAAALSLTFSLLQWENLTWGFQVQFVGVYAAAAWGLYAFCVASREPQALRWRWMAGAVALLVVASFSMANGLLAGAAMLQVAFLTRRGRTAMAVAGLSTAVLIAVYLQGYHSPPHPEPHWSLWERLARVAAYLVCYLGNIWSPHATPLAALLGAIGAAGAVGMLAVMARERSGDAVRGALLGLVLFVGMSAAMTAAGRAFMGLWSASSSRYTTPIAYFWGAQALFWAMTAARGGGRATRAVLGAALIAAILRVVALQPAAFERTLVVHRDIAQASSVLLGDVEDGTSLILISAFVRRPVFDDGVAFLRREHLAMFADPPAAAVGAAFTRPAAPAGACRGGFDILAPAPIVGEPPQPPAVARMWHAAGWAWDVAAHRAVSQTVLVDDAGRVAGIGVSGVKRPRPDDGLHAWSDPTSGWVASVRRGAGGAFTAYGVTAAGSACVLGRRALPQ